MLFVFILMGLFGAAALAFAVQNPQPVALTFLTWQTISLPLSFVILVSSFIGVLVASVSGFAEKITLQIKIRALEKQVAELVADRWAPAPLREPMRDRLAPSVPDPSAVPAPPARTAVRAREN